MKKFTLWWLNGNREVVSGRTLNDAMNRAGYAHGAVMALDFYSRGDSDKFVRGEQSWVLK